MNPISGGNLALVCGWPPLSAGSWLLSYSLSSCNHDDLLTSSLFFLTTEHIYVDVDFLPLVPQPYKIYSCEGLEPTDTDATGTTYGGWRLEVTVDPRDTQKHEALKKGGKVIRPAIEPFKFLSWIRNGNIVLQMPLLSWQDRGNDDHLLRERYSSLPGFDCYMNGRDAFRKKFIADNGVHKYQSATKNVVFHLMSSQKPSQLFDLKAEDIKINAGKPDGHMAVQFHSYFEEEEFESVRETKTDTGMDTEEKITVLESTRYIRLSYYCADLGIALKRAGEDAFKEDTTVADELAAAMQADLKFGGGGRRVKKKC